MLCSCSALFGAWFACLSGSLPRLEIGRIELNPVALGPVDHRTGGRRQRGMDGWLSTWWFTLALVHRPWEAICAWWKVELGRTVFFWVLYDEWGGFPVLKVVGRKN